MSKCNICTVFYINKVTEVKKCKSWTFAARGGSMLPLWPWAFKQDTRPLTAPWLHMKQREWTSLLSVWLRVIKISRKFAWTTTFWLGHPQVVTSQIWGVARWLKGYRKHCCFLVKYGIIWPLLYLLPHVRKGHVNFAVWELVKLFL